MQTSNIFDLTARDSAWAGLPRFELLLGALKAIRDGKLQAHFGSSLRAGLTLKDLIKQAIFALEQNPQFYVGWFREILVYVNDYRAWRSETNHVSAPDEGRRRHRANFKDVVSKMKSYVMSEQKEGSDTSQKRAWEYMKAELPGATYKQTIDAFREVAGTKPRGRPRLSS